MPDQVVLGFADQWPFWWRLPARRIVQVFHFGFSMNASVWGAGTRSVLKVVLVLGGVGLPMQQDFADVCFREVVVLIFGVADQGVDSFCRGFLVVPGCHPHWKWICFHCVGCLCRVCLRLVSRGVVLGHSRAVLCLNVVFRFVLVSVQVDEDRDSVKICFGLARKTISGA